MNNKGVIVVLTIIITALCLFYLSFTFVAQRIQQQYAQLLQSYWEVSRTSFTSQLPAEELAAFQSLWNKLRRHVVQIPNPALIP